MRILAIIVLLALLVPVYAQPTELNISPDKPFYLRGDDITISGRLLSGSVPIPGATVYLYINGSNVDSTETDSDGRFSFSYTIPLSRPAGTVMNITVYYPGDAYHYPSRDNKTIRVYGTISTDINIVGHGDSIEAQFTDPTSISVSLSALFDNGSNANIDRYAYYSFESPSGELGDSIGYNDTSNAIRNIDIPEPLAGTIVVEAYCDIPGFLFSDSLDVATSKTLNVKFYDLVYVQANVTPGVVGGNISVLVNATDDHGYYDILRDAILSSTVRLIIGIHSLTPIYSNASIVASGVFAIFNYTVPACRGGRAVITGDINLPSYMKLASISKNTSSIILEPDNLELVFPQEYPNGVPVTFEPYIRNTLTDDEKPLMPYVDEINASSGTLLTRGNNLILIASGDITIYVTASANTTNALFYYEGSALLRGIDVNIETNASGTIKIAPNENFTIFLNITPWIFDDLEAIARVTVGNDTYTYTFNGTLVLTFYASQLANNTMIEISLGSRNSSLLVVILAPSSPSNPTNPANPGQSAGGQAYMTVLTVVLLAILIGLLVYLFYLIIKRLSKSRGKKKTTPLTPLEAGFQNLRRIFSSGNYKLLAIEAYRFLVSQIAPRFGVTIKPNDTPRMVAKKLVTAGASSSAVMTIVGAYEIAKYSQFEITEETAKEILGAVSALIKTLPTPTTVTR